MELQLVVLAGAKHGTKIPLKKDKFVIGRSKECTLRAGSDAVSRRHCAILRTDEGWKVRDLGSRNGTFLNDQRLESEAHLKPGDELRVGPLTFQVETRDASKLHHEPAAEDVKPSKQPPVKSVGDVVQRTAEGRQGGASEDDISRWLLGTADPKTDELMKETRRISLEETSALKSADAPQEQQPQPSPESAEGASPDQAKQETEASNGDEQPQKGGWSSWLKIGKGKGKKGPGKLPDRPAEDNPKDSCEAAADILREMTRRR